MIVVVGVTATSLTGFLEICAIFISPNNFVKN
jgi:hypothetical protein